MPGNRVVHAGVAGAAGAARLRQAAATAGNRRVEPMTRGRASRVRVTSPDAHRRPRRPLRARQPPAPSRARSAHRARPTRRTRGRNAGEDVAEDGAGRGSKRHRRARRATALPRPTSKASIPARAETKLATPNAGNLAERDQAAARAGPSRAAREGPRAAARDDPSHAASNDPSFTSNDPGLTAGKDPRRKTREARKRATSREARSSSGLTAMDPAAARSVRRDPRACLRGSGAPFGVSPRGRSWRRYRASSRAGVRRRLRFNVQV